MLYKKKILTYRTLYYLNTLWRYDCILIKIIMKFKKQECFIVDYDLLLKQNIIKILKI